MDGRGTQRRALRHRARPGVLRGIHVQPARRWFQARPGAPRAAARCLGLRAHRLPGPLQPSRELRQHAHPSLAFPRVAHAASGGAGSSGAVARDGHRPMSRDDSERLDLYITPAHPCGYLPDRAARTVFVDPDLAMDNRLYSLLASHGFRRNGPHVYKPHCEGCRACIPLRIPVEEFRPDRGQQRVWKRNQDLRIESLDATTRPEHYALYRRYLAARHAGGGMDGSSEPEYAHFLMNPWGRTRMLAMHA